MSDGISSGMRGITARICEGWSRISPAFSGWKVPEPIISVGRRREIFSMDALRQQSPTAGKPRTEQTSAHHGVTATSWFLPPIAQRIEVQDGASETMRNPMVRFAVWRRGVVLAKKKRAKRQQED